MRCLCGGGAYEGWMEYRDVKCRDVRTLCTVGSTHPNDFLPSTHDRNESVPFPRSIKFRFCYCQSLSIPGLESDPSSLLDPLGNLIWINGLFQKRWVVFPPSSPYFRPWRPHFTWPGQLWTPRPCLLSPSQSLYGPQDEFRYLLECYLTSQRICNQNLCPSWSWFVDYSKLSCKVLSQCDRERKDTFHLLFTIGEVRRWFFHPLVFVATHQLLQVSSYSWFSSKLVHLLFIQLLCGSRLLTKSVKNFVYILLTLIRSRIPDCSMDSYSLALIINSIVVMCCDGRV